MSDKISIYEAFKRIAPNMVALALLREGKAGLSDEKIAEILEHENSIKTEVIETLLLVDWKRSAKRLVDIIAEMRKKNGIEEA